MVQNLVEFGFGVGLKYTILVVVLAVDLAVVVVDAVVIVVVKVVIENTSEWWCGNT